MTQPCWYCGSLRTEPFSGHPDFVGWYRCADCGTLLSPPHADTDTPACGMGGCDQKATHVAAVHWFSDIELSGQMLVCERHGNELIDDANAGKIEVDELLPLGE